jgi:hypothetical protein
MRAVVVGETEGSRGVGAGVALVCRGIAVERRARGHGARGSLLRPRTMGQGGPQGEGRPPDEHGDDHGLGRRGEGETRFSHCAGPRPASSGRPGGRGRSRPGAPPPTARALCDPDSEALREARLDGRAQAGVRPEDPPGARAPDGGGGMTGSEPLTDAEIKNLKKFFEEKTGILERAAGLLRPEAEAGRSTGTYARNQRCLWASLRAALSRYPVLVVQLSDTPGPVGRPAPWHGQGRHAKGPARGATEGGHLGVGGVRPGSRPDSPTANLVGSK